MARKPIELNFRIDAYSPATMPMSRLAEYLADLAAMLGENDSVHFVELRDGSTQLIHAIEAEAYPKIVARTRAIATGDAPAEAIDAYQDLNKKLAQDNASATYTTAEGGGEILSFPGARAPRTLGITPVDQPGSIDGVVIGVGGRSSGKNMVPIIIDTGEGVISCQAPRSLAKELGHHLFDVPRRYHGSGHWLRDERGTWTLKRFQIGSHEELDDTPLTEAVAKLRAVRSDLGRGDTPLADILRDRGEGDPN